MQKKMNTNFHCKSLYKLGSKKKHVIYNSVTMLSSKLLKKEVHVLTNAFHKKQTLTSSVILL